MAEILLQPLMATPLAKYFPFVQWKASSLSMKGYTLPPKLWMSMT
jgi:hypothetical protein